MEVTGREGEGVEEVRQLVMKEGRRQGRKGEEQDWGESTYLSFSLISPFFVSWCI